MTLAHIGGLPVEEAVASLAPALSLGVVVAWVKLRARLRRAPLRSARTGRDPAGY